MYNDQKKQGVYDIAVIGGGASGLMLTASFDLGKAQGGSEAQEPEAERSAARGIILEGTARMGSKLLMSGGGHCNITHGGPVKDFLNAYGASGPLLRRCLYKHSNYELVSWLSSKGIPTADETGKVIDPSNGARSIDNIGRIFPASMKAKDVLDLFIAETKRNRWEIRTNSKVRSLRFHSAGSGQNLHGREKADPSEGIWIAELSDGSTVASKAVVIATGGITYPGTGSDGSMFRIMRDLGIEITEPRPALAPVFVKDYPYGELSGVSVPDVTVTVYSSDAACTCNGKAARMTGDLLFTHKGFSGPVILNISKYASAGETIRLSYNKKLSELPKRMKNILENRARGDSGDIRTKALASLLDHDDFVISGTDSSGMVTSGGVDLSAVDMSTMMIRRFEGGRFKDEESGNVLFSDNEHLSGRTSSNLYVIGEALDADGITGGYNLQLCWSTARSAADSLKLYSTRSEAPTSSLDWSERRRKQTP